MNTPRVFAEPMVLRKAISGGTQRHAGGMRNRAAFAVISTPIRRPRMTRALHVVSNGLPQAASDIVSENRPLSAVSEPPLRWACTALVVDTASALGSNNVRI